MDAEMGRDHLPAPQEEDEPFSPRLGRVRSAPNDQPQPVDRAQGDAAPQEYFTPSSSGKGNPSAMGVPVRQSPQEFPFPIPDPGSHSWSDSGAALWGTGVSAAPGGLSTFPDPQSQRGSVCP